MTNGWSVSEPGQAEFHRDVDFPFDGFAFLQGRGPGVCRGGFDDADGFGREPRVGRFGNLDVGQRAVCPDDEREDNTALNTFLQGILRILDPLLHPLAEILGRAAPERGALGCEVDELHVAVGIEPEIHGAGVFHAGRLAFCRAGFPFRGGFEHPERLLRQQLVRRLDDGGIGEGAVLGDDERRDDPSLNTFLHRFGRVFHPCLHPFAEGEEVAVLERRHRLVVDESILIIPYIRGCGGFFGGDDDHAVPAPRTIRRNGGFIFEYVYACDRFLVQVVDVRMFDAVDDAERFIVFIARSYADRDEFVHPHLHRNPDCLRPGFCRGNHDFLRFAAHVGHDERGARRGVDAGMAVLSVTVPLYVPAITTTAPASGLSSRVTATCMCRVSSVRTVSAGVCSVSGIRISAARVVNEKAHSRPVTTGSVPASRSRVCLPDLGVVII